VLRVLQEQKFERLGGEKTITVNVRIISATNKNLSTATTEGLFREDLYYRLKVLTISLPPLREREGDIVILANHFVEVFSKTHNKEIQSIEPEAMRALHAYHWPGNVRELGNALESAVVLAGGNILRVEDIPPEIVQSQAAMRGAGAIDIDQNLPFRDWKKRMVETAEREYFIRHLEKNDHNISKTARSLEMHRQSLQQKLRELEIDVKKLHE
jgi:two-component system response regulator AtoC/two-component system nitrogen regulation response regulator NtrX